MAIIVQPLKPATADSSVSIKDGSCKIEADNNAGPSARRQLAEAGSLISAAVTITSNKAEAAKHLALLTGTTANGRRQLSSSGGGSSSNSGSSSDNNAKGKHSAPIVNNGGATKINCTSSVKVK